MLISREGSPWSMLGKTHKTERLRKLKPFKLKKSRHRISKIELSLLEKFYTLYFKITKNLHLKKWKLLMD
jgi:hypothetical protein